LISFSFFFFFFHYQFNKKINFIGNDYWRFTYQSQNQKNQKKTIFENSKIFDEELFEELKKILEILEFDLSKVEKVIGNENIDLKEIFKGRCEQIFQKLKDDPIRYKKENWYEGNNIELRKSMVQHLGDYISKFKQFGWNYGNNVNFFFSFLSFSKQILVHIGICNSNDPRNK